MADRVSTLGYRTVGAQHGRPLCLIHGWGLDSSFLSPIVQMFPERPIRLIDLPGYGLSRKLEDFNLSFDDTVQALANTIPEGSDVMAASLGSLYAISALSKSENKAASLVTICSNARFPKDPNWPGMSSSLFVKCRTLLTPKRCARVLNLFVKMQILDNRGQHNELIDKMLENYELPSYQTLIDGLNLASYADLRESLKYLKIPCLQLYGAKDRFVPASLTYALEKGALRTSYIFANSAHNPYLTEPELFEKVVREFYDKVHTFLHD